MNNDDNLPLLKTSIAMPKGKLNLIWSGPKNSVHWI